MPPETALQPSARGTLGRRRGKGVDIMGEEFWGILGCLMWDPNQGEWTQNGRGETQNDRTKSAVGCFGVGVQEHI